MPIPSDATFTLVNNMESATAFMQWLGSVDAGDKVAVDTEGTGLNKRTDRARLCQFGGHRAGWSIPVDSWKGLINEALSRFTGEIIMHNAPYDWSMIHHTGYDIDRSKIHDTRLMSQILEPNQFNALKSQTERHVDHAAAGSQHMLHDAMKNNGWDWSTVPIDFPLYWIYAAIDTVLTRHLFDVHHPRIISTGAHVAYDLERSAQWVLDSMENYGARIDRTYAATAKQEFDTWVSTTESEIWEQYGVKPGSNQKVIELFESWGYVFSKPTKSGALSLDKEVLAWLLSQPDAPGWELASKISRRRKRQKLSSTYLRAFLDGTEVDGFLHPSINPIGARTGRMSMSEPNLQNLPRRSEFDVDGNVVRNCVVARPGHTLLMCDFDQIEMRLLAWISQCAPMMSAFRDDGDFFINLARNIYQDPTIQKSDPRRQLTKNGGYATIYGAGIPKFALTAGVSEDVARQFFARWDALYPEVKNFQRAVDRTAWNRKSLEGTGYVQSPLTRRFHIADDNRMYTLVNYLIQGTAAELFKMKLLELDASGLGPWLMLPVHDEIILDVPNDQVPYVVDVLHNVMNDNAMISVPITASASYGQRWGDKQDWTTEDAWLNSIGDGAKT